ncbi:MAG: hypothetical protein ACTSU2_02250 [Promethearchaeota archaeon]
MMKNRYKGYIILFSYTLSILIGILGMFVVVSPDTTNLNGNVNNGINQNMNKDNISYGNDLKDSDFSINLSPFYNHTDNDTLTYIKLKQEGFINSKVLFYHSFNYSDNYNIVDDHIYAADQFYYMLGSGLSIYPKLLIPGAFDELKETPLWDDEDGGFYRILDNNRSVISDDKRVFDNLLVVLFLLNGLGDTQTYGLDNKIDSMWTTIKSLFWDSHNNAFNFSAESSYSERYSTDNFLGAIVAFRIAEEKQLSQSLRTDALSTGNLIMDNYNTSEMFDSTGYPSFFNTSNIANQRIVTSDKFLLPNALGISALIEWSIANGKANNSVAINKSISIWNFIKSKLYNSTYDMYMTRMSQPGANIFNYNMSLLDNAWMLKATLDLFKVTGNLTYYKEALKHFYGIENNLYNNSKYCYSMNIGPQGLSDIATMDSYNALMMSLAQFYQYYSSTKIEGTLNQSDYIYLNDTQFNFTATYKISLTFNYSETVNSYWTIDTPIPSASIFYTLRNPNNDSIVNEKVLTSDINGSSNYIYNISQNLPLGFYRLSVFGNLSGYNPSYVNLYINYSSALLFQSGNILDPAYQGETIKVNVSFLSARNDNLSVTLKYFGDGVQSQQLDDLVVLNESVTTFTLNITLDSNISLGDQHFTLQLFNGSVQLLEHNVSFTVLSAVNFTFVKYYNYVLDFNPLNCDIRVYNNRENAIETINVTISGDDFETNSLDIANIAPKSYKTQSIQLIPKVQKYGMLSFNVSLYRNGELFYSQIYYIEAVPEVKIDSINYPHALLMGETPYITISLTNYNITDKAIYVEVNGKSLDPVKVKFGSSQINVAIDRPYSNALDILPKSYNILIKNKNGEIIATKLIVVKPIPSLATILYVFIIPLAVAITIILVYKNKELDWKKRFK